MYAALGDLSLMAAHDAVPRRALTAHPQPSSVQLNPLPARTRHDYTTKNCCAALRSTTAGAVAGSRAEEDVVRICEETLERYDDELRTASNNEFESC
jgi:hypothetical protein